MGMVHKKGFDKGKVRKCTIWGMTCALNEAQAKVWAIGEEYNTFILIIKKITYISILLNQTFSL